MSIQQVFSSHHPMSTKRGAPDTTREAVLSSLDRRVRRCFVEDAFDVNTSVHTRRLLATVSATTFVALSTNTETEVKRRKIGELLRDGVKLHHIPMLSVDIPSDDDEEASIVAHEGRNRVRVLMDIHGDDVRIPVHLDGNFRWLMQSRDRVGRYDYIENWPEILLSETGEDVGVNMDDIVQTTYPTFTRE